MQVARAIDRDQRIDRWRPRYYR